MKKLYLIAAAVFLLSLSNVASAIIGMRSMGPEEVNASVNCVVKDITVLAKSEYECKAIDGEVSAPYKEIK
jgi:hypothetical protein